MRVVTKRIMIVCMGFVCLLLVACLTLSLIVVRPIDRLGDGGTIRVMSSFTTAQATNDELNKSVADAAKTVKFSVMRSVLELSTKYGITPAYKTEDGESVRANLSANNIKSLRPVGEQFMLQIKFDSVQTNAKFVDADGNKIKYDRVVMLMGKSDNKISDVKLYPYLAFNMNNSLSGSAVSDEGHVSTEFYKVYEFRAKMYTYSMYNTLTDNFVTGSGGTVA